MASKLEKADTLTVPVDLEKASSNSSSTETDTQAASEPSAEPAFPEGGLQAWLTVFGATLAQFCTFGYTNGFGVYQDYYVRRYLTHSSPSAIGWIEGVQIFLIFSSGIFTGRLFDKGYFHYLMLLGAFLHGLALFMLSLSHPNQYYQVFLAQGICLGLSCGLVYIPSLTVVSHYFHRRRALAMGIVAGGSALGAALHPILLNNLFQGKVGFHNGVRISAGINVFLLIVANCVMRTRLPPRKHGSALPLKDFLRDPPYVFMVAGGLLTFCGLFFPVFYLQLNAVTHGVNKTFAFYSLTILNGASLFGRTIPTIWAPKIGVFNMLAFFAIGTGIVTISFVAVKDEAGTAIFAVLYGLFSGAAISMTPPALATLGRNVSEIGVRIGVAFGICGVLGLFATPIAGALLTSKFDWIRPILFSGITMVAAGGCFCISRYFVMKRHGSQWV